MENGYDKVKIPEFQVERVLNVLSQQQGWGIKQLNIPSAWSHTKGEGVLIAVIDTGMTDHPDVDGNCTTGENFVPYESDMDLNGHQTHCVGIICAKNNDMGMVGVAPESKVVCVKALDKNGSGTYRMITDALEYCRETLKPDIVSMSLGGTSGYQPMHDEIKKLHEMGIPVVCAAGNSGLAGVNYPAAYEETIAVAAYDKNGNIANFSSKGEQVDFSAPGVNIYSTYLNNTYARLNGTSMACPFLAGVIALLISRAKHVGTKLSVDTIKEELISHADDKGLTGKDGSWGYGVVDVVEMLEDDPFSPEFPEPEPEQPVEEDPFSPEFPEPEPEQPPVTPTPPAPPKPVEPSPIPNKKPIWKYPQFWWTVGTFIASGLIIYFLADYHNKQDRLENIDWDKRLEMDLRDKNMSMQDWFNLRR